MNSNIKSTETKEVPASNCQYKPFFDESDQEDDNWISPDCACAPMLTAHQCHCTGVSNRWARESNAKRNRQPRQRGLIAYIRTSGGGLSAAEQEKIISDYCQDNEYYVKDIFIDHGRPGAGLKRALDAVEHSDGLISADLDRFVEHFSDRLRDLRPFVHHFFCHPSKHLVSVLEGVDTGSVQGQANVVRLLNKSKETRQFT